MFQYPTHLHRLDTLEREFVRDLQRMFRRNLFVFDIPVVINRHGDVRMSLSFDTDMYDLLCILMLYLGFLELLWSFRLEEQEQRNGKKSYILKEICRER